MYKDITGVILSGGKSLRMGVNKSLLKIGNQTFIERTKNLMSGIFEKLILITNEPELYNFLNIESYSDIYIANGPLSGIHSGLYHSQTNKDFIMSCDMPFIDSKTIEFIVNYNSSKSIVVPKADGYIQQLCGVYNNNLLPEIESLLLNSKNIETRDTEQHKRKCSVHNLIESVDSEIIDAEKEYKSYHKDLFFNMNSPEDYEYIKNKIIQNS